MNPRLELLKKYRRVRQASLSMSASLEPEQCRIQSCPDVSPVWWNLGHTSWFFVRNVLESFGGKKTKNDELFDYVLNSYYVSLGPRVERARRGVMTRPTMKEVYDYRESVDDRMERLIADVDDKRFLASAPIIELGLQHEQQHQELFYTEIKNILYQNPLKLRQTYHKRGKQKAGVKATKQQFIKVAGGLDEFGNREGGWG